MTAASAPAAGRRSLADLRRSDWRIVLTQLRYEQLAFWRNRFGAVFTIGFSVLFLVLLGSSGGTQRLQSLLGLRAIQYYTAGFAAYGVMSACFNTLAISLVNRREMGLLKRLRISPLPTPALLAAILGNAAVIAVAQVVVLLVIGRLAYHVELPHAWGALAVDVAAGVLCFTVLGVAVSTLIPNQEAAGPIVSIVYFVLLFLSGLWFPLEKGSALARISAWFPVRHLIVATFAPFDLRPGVSPWAWHDIFAMAVWGLAGLVVALRRFRWEPSRR